MKTPTIKQAPPFDAERMERRSGSLRSVPVRVDKVEAAELAAVAATAWSEAKAEAKVAAEALKRAKTTDTKAKADLEEALEEVEERLDELKTGWEHIDAEVERHMVWAKNVVREVRLDPGFEGVLFDEYAMDPEDRHDLLASPKAKKPEAKTDREVGDRYMALRGFVETAWKHRHPADRMAFIDDVMGYGQFERADVQLEVDAFLAVKRLEGVVLIDVAEWLANDTDAASDGYKGATHEEMVDLLAGDVAKDVKTVLVDGVECEVDIDQVRDAVESTVTRGQRDLVLAKMDDVQGKTPKALAKETGLDVERVTDLLAAAKVDGLADKPKGKRSWFRLPVAETARVLAALPMINTADNAGKRIGKTIIRLAEDTGLPERLVDRLLTSLFHSGDADVLDETPDEWVRLKADEPPKSLGQLMADSEMPPGEFEGEEFDAAMLGEGPARERVIAKLVALLPSSDNRRPSSKTPSCLANDAGIHLLDVGRLLLWAHERSLVHKVDGRNSGGWVRLPAAVVADLEPTTAP